MYPKTGGKAEMSKAETLFLSSGSHELSPKGLPSRSVPLPMSSLAEVMSCDGVKEQMYTQGRKVWSRCDPERFTRSAQVCFVVAGKMLRLLKLKGLVPDL